MPLIFSFDIGECPCYFAKLFFLFITFFCVCRILRISTFEIMSCLDIDNSTSFQIEIPLFYLSVCLSFVTVMPKTLMAVLHRSGKNQHSYQRKHFQTSSLAVMLAVSFTCVCVLSCVQHFTAFCTLAHQAPLSMGLSSQE